MWNFRIHFSLVNQSKQVKCYLNLSTWCSCSSIKRSSLCFCCEKASVGLHPRGRWGWSIRCWVKFIWYSKVVFSPYFFYSETLCRFLVLMSIFVLIIGIRQSFYFYTFISILDFQSILLIQLFFFFR